MVRIPPFTEHFLLCQTFLNLQQTITPLETIYTCNISKCEVFIETQCELYTVGVCLCRTRRSSSSDILSSHCRTLCYPAAGAYCSRPVCSENPAQVQTHTRYFEILNYTCMLSTNLNTCTIKLIIKTRKKRIHKH